MAKLSLWVDYSQLAALRDFVVQTSHELGLDSATTYDLQLAVDEACTNVVRHAYDGESGRIELEIQATGEGVRVTVWDWGQPFDPENIPEPDVTAPLEQRPLGGLGLFLMRQTMDEVQFDFDPEKGNRLTMLKRIQRRA
jgi:serine/threonine-protein kinase RsbW